MIRMGYQHSRVVPILMDFDFKGIDTNPVLQEMYKDDFVNLIFVGRLSPNKCQHDIIRLYGYFKKFVRERSRLFLIGKYDGFESYYTQLIRYAARLKLGDLYLTGRVSLQELVTYYRIADVFVSMSEHEGFGVPLIESMFFGIPVVAFRAAAVPGTMGDSGILFSDKTRMIEIAELIGHLVESADFRENIVFRQKQRFDRCFSPASVERQWMHILTEF